MRTKDVVERGRGWEVAGRSHSRGRGRGHGVDGRGWGHARDQQDLLTITGYKDLIPKEAVSID